MKNLTLLWLCLLLAIPCFGHCEHRSAESPPSVWRSNTNCIRLLRFLYLAQTTGGSLKRSLGMARCSLCKAQHLITIGITLIQAVQFAKTTLNQ